MFESIILGFIQGVAEWLPVSSEGLILLVEKKFFHAQGFESLIEKTLFLHLGTFLAALIYFHKDVLVLLKTCRTYQRESEENKKLFNFLFISTLISGVLGITLIKIFDQLMIHFDTAGNIITLLIGILLLITASLQIKAQRPGNKNMNDLKPLDGIILGIAQGCSALPGLSRSGLTMASLLLRQFDKRNAVKLSFLMSLPIVLTGGLFLHLKGFSISLELLAGMATSFIVGLLTIHLFLKIAEKINFGYFLIGMAVLIILSSFI